MTGNGIRIRVLRMGLSKIPSGQDLRGPQAFPCAQIPLDAFFQLAAPEDPVRQLFSALGFIDAPQSFQSRQRLILRQAQKIQQLTADQSVISRSGLRSLFRRISFVTVRSPEVISRSYVP